MLYIRNPKTKLKWLIDGGALLSILPPLPAQRRKGPNGTQLSAANGTSIPCYGSVRHVVTIGRKVFPFTFIIADVKQPIIGADFLAKFYLAPNHRDGCLVNLQNFESIQADLAEESPTTRINFISQKEDPYYQLLDKYPDLSTPSFRIKEPKHGVYHYIPTQCNPIQSRARKLAPDKLAVAKSEIEKLCQLGVCRRGKSEWASPLMVAKKPCVSPCTCTPTTPCGGWRVCGDYRRLNTQTTDDKYPVRTLTDFNNELCGKKIFSKIDLLKGYHQIPVNEDDVKKTGVITPFGLFLFPRTPFGLKNAGQDFQRLMDEILGDIPHTFVYIDDILVASETPEQHLEDLKRVFEVLDDNGLVINRKKCVLGVPSLEFLGYLVNQHGIAPLPQRVEAIRRQKRPTTTKELQRFLGMVNYYRRSIRSAAHHLCHLFDALKGKKGAAKARVLIWTKGCQESFEAIKEALAKAALLRHPRPNAKLAITADASKQAIGAVLEQRGPLGWEPLGFFSAKLEGKQPDWPAFDRELLAAFRAIRHFRHMIEGRNFTLYTDHDSLVPALHKKTEPLTARQTYQLSCIAEFTTDIQYLEGKANVVADQLSRPSQEAPTPSIEAITQGERSEPTATPSHSLESPPIPQDKQEDLGMVVCAIGQYNVNLEEMAQDQALDPDFQRISQEARTGLNFKKVNIGRTSIIVDVSNGPARPFVPLAWRRRVFEAIHNLGHPGVDRTRQAVAAKFVWPSLRQDVSRWARECLPCQQSKVRRHVIPPIGHFEVPTKRFQHWNVDIVTMPESNGFKYLLTAVDRLSRWPLAVPLHDATAASVIDAFSHGLIATYGVPESITTDNGVQFTSAIWRQLMEVWGINSHFTTPYHPASNGLVERFHRRLRESLNALGTAEPNLWYWKLPCSLLSIRTTLKPDVGASPADLVYGEGLAVPGELVVSSPIPDNEVTAQRQRLLDNLRLEVARIQPVPTSAHRRPAVHLPEDLRTATHVFVQRGGVQPSMATPYVGPYRVLERRENFFKVAIPGGSDERVAIARIKPAIMHRDDQNGTQPPSPIPPSPPTNPGSPPAGHPNRDTNTQQCDPGEGTSSQARVRLDSNATDEEEEFLARLRRSRQPCRFDNSNEDSNLENCAPGSRDPQQVADPTPPAPPERNSPTPAPNPRRRKGAKHIAEYGPVPQPQTSPHRQNQQFTPGAGGHGGRRWRPRSQRGPSPPPPPLPSPPPPLPPPAPPLPQNRRFSPGAGGHGGHPWRTRNQRDVSSVSYASSLAAIIKRHVLE